MVLEGRGVRGGEVSSELWFRGVAEPAKRSVGLTLSSVDELPKRRDVQSWRAHGGIPW